MMHHNLSFKNTLGTHACAYLAFGNLLDELLVLHPELRNDLISMLLHPLSHRRCLGELIQFLCHVDHVLLHVLQIRILALQTNERVKECLSVTSTSLHPLHENREALTSDVKTVTSMSGTLSQTAEIETKYAQSKQNRDLHTHYNGVKRGRTNFRHTQGRERRPAHYWV